MSSPQPPSAGDRRASSIRVLVVDDYAPFRRFVFSTLVQQPDFKIVGEASDGLEAVEKAQQLRPDLIVLDIGLPKLNGIEAARRIRKLSPQSKILILSQESSAAVVQEVLSVGALGYVVKAHAGSELLAAVEAVCKGRQFVSRGISGSNGVGAKDARVPGHLGSMQVLPSSAPRQVEINRSHAVEFYSDDASLLVGFTHFIEASLEDGDAVIVVTTEAHQINLLQSLHARGLNIGAAIELGSYIALDVADTLSTFMVNNLPDPVRFRKVAGDLVAAAAKGAKGDHPRVAACGECAPTLWAQGKAEAAIQVEHLWDEIARTCEVDILCGYVLNSIQREQESHIYEKICAEHSAVCAH